MKPLILIVDAFADRPFAGNPAAVVPLERPADPDWMQRVAGEMNLSETCFLTPGDEAWGLRWFTPVREVDLCGHATLAAAHAVWELGLSPRERPIIFDTRSGRLGAVRDREGFITLELPAKPPREIDIPDALRSTVENAEWFGTDGTKLLAVFRSEDHVRVCEPDLPAIASLDAEGLIVTARSEEPDIDFVSRFFAPAVGIDEDPVCGSAHCSLGPYWAERLGKDELTAAQLSARGGRLRVSVREDRIGLGGRAVTTLRGELTEEACR